MNYEKSLLFHSDSDWKWQLKFDKQNLQQDVYLQQLKHELNAVKDQLSEYEISLWGKHTSSNDPASKVVKHVTTTIRPRPFCTNAWCKFYELLTSLRLLNDLDLSESLVSVHLCEAPGAFICALNHYIKTNYHGMMHNWYANTLNPYHENNSVAGSMIPDDRLIRLTFDHWLFGADNTGDITKQANIDSIVHTMKAISSSVQLVTGDGSIDCQLNPAEQEMLVYPVILSEVITAVQLLSPGGTAVLKLFTFFELHTAALLFRIACMFSKIRIHKPVTSKPGNSEVYLVCSGFKSVTPDQLSELHTAKETGNPLLSLDELPSTFITQLRECASYFKTLQQDTITHNIITYKQECGQANDSSHYENAEDFVSRLGLQAICANQSVAISSKYKRQDIMVTGINSYGTDVTDAKSICPPKKRKIKGNFVERQNLTLDKKRQEILTGDFYPEKPLTTIFYNEIVCPDSHTSLDVVNFIDICNSVKALEMVVNSWFCDNTLLQDYVAVNAREDNFYDLLCCRKCLHALDDNVVKSVQSSLRCAHVVWVENSEIGQALVTEHTQKDLLYIVESCSVLQSLKTLLQRLKYGDHLMICNVNTLLRTGAGVVFLLWHCFDEIAVVNHSMCGLPSLVFKRFIANSTENILSVLEEKLHFEESKYVVEIIPLPIILSCTRLHAFLCDINNESLRRAINTLIRRYKKNSST